jgi:hypothetical protein
VEDPAVVAEAFLAGHFDALQATPLDIDGLVLESRHTSEHNGVSHLYYGQAIAEIAVLSTKVNVNVGRDGAVLSVGANIVPDAFTKTNAMVPAITSVQALQLLVLPVRDSWHARAARVARPLCCARSTIDSVRSTRSRAARPGDCVRSVALGKIT